MTTSRPSDRSVVATNVLNWMFYGGGQHVGPSGCYWVQRLVYGFHLNLLCEHATRQESLPLWGHCFCGPLMLRERSGVNLLQNFFCCEKTPVCQTWNSMQMCIGFLQSQRNLRGKRKDLSKNSHPDFQELKNLLLWVLFQSPSKSLPKKSYISTYWKYKHFPRVRWAELFLAWCSERIASEVKVVPRKNPCWDKEERASSWLEHGRSRYLPRPALLPAHPTA